MKIYARQDESVDEICLRHYGHTRQVVEQVYRVNHGLAEQGTRLPMGYPLEMPEQLTATPRETINLWS